MSNLIQSDLSKELGQNFINYAAAVNGDRAIPDALTGLKPVARRIMFIMEDEGVSSSKPHRKCAKTVGSVMGRVHPHGDSSIYEAMVRLSQSWVMRYPLIDWHGNNGNIGGDGAAAHRYTESRLAKIAEEGLLANLKKKNVDWQPNYSEDEEPPWQADRGLRLYGQRARLRAKSRRGSSPQAKRQAGRGRRHR